MISMGLSARLAKKGCKDQGAENGYAGIGECGDQPGLHDEAQEGSAHAYPDGGERFIIPLYREGDVVDARRAEDDFQQVAAIRRFPVPHTHTAGEAAGRYRRDRC